MHKTDLWLLDQWLARHPHWEWWLLPYWGDPFYTAYCLVWSNYYHKHEQILHRIEVGYDNLSPQFREDYEKDFGDNP